MRHRLSIVVIVLNNQVLGFQRDAEDVIFGAHTDACHLGAVDHAAIAEACGARGTRVTRVAEFAPALDQALAAGGCHVIDVVTDASARPPLTLFRGRLPEPPGADDASPTETTA